MFLLNCMLDSFYYRPLSFSTQLLSTLKRNKRQLEIMGDPLE